MQWDGNPNIELDIRTRVGVGLPVQVVRIFAYSCWRYLIVVYDWEKAIGIVLSKRVFSVHLEHR